MIDLINDPAIFRHNLGTSQKVCHSLRGRGLAKKITKCEMGGGGLSERVMSLPQIYTVSKNAF